MASTNCTTVRIALPDVFCWTRFGVEAGQDVAVILKRKEAERRANGGVFLWGVGNSIIPSLSDLLVLTDSPKAVFSPIQSRPRPVDKATDAVAVWTRARTPCGTPWTLPPHSMVTSHAGRALGRHFALVCRSSHALSLNEDGPAFAMNNLYNLRSSRPVGGSQVTAIVRHQSADRDGGNATSAESGPVYAAAMIVDLVPPYLAVLEAPVIVQASGRIDDEFMHACWNVRAQLPPLVGVMRQYDLFE